MNRQFKKELGYIVAALLLVAQLGAMWTGYQNGNSPIVILAKEKPYFEPIRYVEPTIEEKILETFGDETAVAIAKCESGLNPNAINDNWRDGVIWSKDHGLFQINDFFHTWSGDIYDVDTNITIGKRVYDSQGYWGWSCFKSGAYLKFL